MHNNEFQCGHGELEKPVRPRWRVLAGSGCMGLQTLGKPGTLIWISRICRMYLKLGEWVSTSKLITSIQSSKICKASGLKISTGTWFFHFQLIKKYVWKHIHKGLIWAKYIKPPLKLCCERIWTAPGQEARLPWRKIHIPMNFHRPSHSWKSTKSGVVTTRHLRSDLVESWLYFQDGYPYTQDIREETQFKNLHYRKQKTTLEDNCNFHERKKNKSLALSEKKA